MVKGYIKQHDAENNRTLMFVLSLTVFETLVSILQLDFNTDFIEVTKALVVADNNGIRYNFEMADGKAFMVYGEHMVAEVQLPEKEVPRVPKGATVEKLPDIGSITSKILKHFYVQERGSEPGYSMSADGIVGMLHANGIDKDQDKLFNIIAGGRSEGLFSIAFGQYSLTPQGREIAKVLIEGARKKGSPAPPPKKEYRGTPTAALDIAREIVQESIEDEDDGDKFDSSPEEVEDYATPEDEQGIVDMTQSEDLGDAIMRVAQAITEPFWRSDVFRVLKLEKPWEHIDINTINDEMFRLVDEEALLFFDGIGFRVTLRDVEGELTDRHIKEVQEAEGPSQEKTLSDMASQFE